MKRRNFLSGLLAIPLALKARLLRFVSKEPVPNLTSTRLQRAKQLAKFERARQYKLLAQYRAQNGL